jgi:hypothetical protein
VLHSCRHKEHVRVSVLHLTRAECGFHGVVELSRFVMASQPCHSAWRLFGCVRAQIFRVEACLVQSVTQIHQQLSCPASHTSSLLLTFTGGLCFRRRSPSKLLVPFTFVLGGRTGGFIAPLKRKPNKTVFQVTSAAFSPPSAPPVPPASPQPCT